MLIVSPCQGAYGGIEAFVLAVAKAVRRESDAEVRVCFKKTRDFQLKPSLARMTDSEDVIFCERGSRDLAAHIAWADVVHSQNAPPDIVALAKLFQKPVALTIHNYMGAPLTLHRRLWKWSARLADARWYNSNFVWNTWEPTRKRRGSLKVPTVSELPQGAAPIQQRSGFAFLGRWIANKGVDLLVEAYARSALDKTRWPLVLLGDGPLRAQIEQRIRELALTSVELTGFVDEQTKAERLRRARWIVVPPNTREDFGLTAIEARSLGVPCIITRDGGLPEAAGDQALVCEPGDVDGLARALERAAAMTEDEYRARSKRTHETLISELRPLTFYADAYRKLLAREPIT